MSAFLVMGVNSSSVRLVTCEIMNRKSSGLMYFAYDILCSIENREGHK
jgi:hypothetical protein